MEYLIITAAFAFAFGIVGTVVNVASYFDERARYVESLKEYNPKGINWVSSPERVKEQLLGAQKWLRIFVAILVLSPLAGFILPFVAAAALLVSGYWVIKGMLETPEKVEERVKE